ncbi:hypothetical protein [Teredinibacter franksiae]|uniref:hypothetical protein n=1 Tax=Teredinibacter franksiae TaxID=2761453 RepID=UPI001626C7B2|nr:hypothetical protein [Teredinibacter franksiae]
MKEHLGSVVGFALGGLAGNNAHGAGFLSAALKHHVTPKLITCTSGQIYWVYKYLKALCGDIPEDALRKEYTRDDKPLNQSVLAWIELFKMGLSGKENKFRPVYPHEMALDFFDNWSSAIVKYLRDLSEGNANIVPLHTDLFKVLPSRTLVSTFPDIFFDDIANTFLTNDEIGLCFNCYDPKRGIEIVYCNELARTLIGVDYGAGKEQRVNTVYLPITANAVREGLWLYEYGRPGKLRAIDGAYYRGVMLSELKSVDKIYVARPINYQWIGEYPTDKYGLMDLKTEVNFNGAYVGEKDKIMLINKLVKKGDLPESQYHTIKLIELEMQEQRGYFGYVKESLKVFDKACEQAEWEFSPQGAHPTPLKSELKHRPYTH